MELSSNGKRELSKIAKSVSMSATGASYLIKKLEKRYGINYFAEMDPKALGYLAYVACIRFYGRQPNIDEIKAAFQPDPRVVAVFRTKGKYDLVIVFWVESEVNLSRFVYKWRISVLSGYTARWYVTFLTIYDGYAFMPRKEFIELIKERVWERSKDIPRRLPTQLNANEYNVLREFVEDGMTSFSSIQDKNNMRLGSASYAFHSLKERGVIKRITISMNSIPIRYNAIFIMETDNYKEYGADRIAIFSELLAPTYGWINKYAIVSDIGLPDAMMLIAPILREEDFSRMGGELKGHHGIRLESLIVLDTLVGGICYRHINPKETAMYPELKTGEKEKNSTNIN
jgi:DNA-binding Lrp family transcriptional regulator